jgi:hypothetical protein
MNVEEKFQGPILVIGWKGYPINRFVTEVIYKGEQFNKFDFSQHDNMHSAYAMGFYFYKKAMKNDGRLYCIEKYTGTLEEFATRRYFNNPIKRKLYNFYLWVGSIFFRQ